MSRIRNCLPPEDKYATSKTANQWKTEGFAPIETAAGGEFMYHNGYKQSGAIYYRPCDVRPATEEEKAQWDAQRRERNRLRIAEYRKRKRKEKEAWLREQNRLAQEQQEHEQREQQRKALAKPFYDEIISSGRKFVPIFIDGHENLGVYTYIADGNVHAGTLVTVPFGEDSTLIGGVVAEGEYTYDDLKDQPWFPSGVKAVHDIVRTHDHS